MLLNGFSTTLRTGFKAVTQLAVPGPHSSHGCGSADESVLCFCRLRIVLDAALLPAVLLSLALALSFAGSAAVTSPLSPLA
jgi:hypothetical protein